MPPVHSRRVKTTTTITVLLLIGVIALPFILRSQGSADARPDPNARTLIIITPHVQQIQDEFGEAFVRWHRHEYPDEPPVRVDFRHPGGTSEIRKLLASKYIAELKAGRIDPVTFACEQGTMPFDLMFGGGTYDHDQLVSGVRTTIDGAEVSMPMSVPMDLDDATLLAWFGDGSGSLDPMVGSKQLFHDDLYWVGTALSGFGIVYNRHLLSEMGRDEPTTVEDLVDPDLMGWIALCDPRQSGSIETTFESILDNYGWAAGWRILRALSANTRYFTDKSTKPPIDVAQGEAAYGLAIDFYGRSQSQSVMQEGETPETSRVGYIDPPGKVFIDPDPISMLRGGPDPELALRFVRFVNSDLGQSLWQFPARSGEAGTDNPLWEDGEPMGPARYELRRMPAVRSMYRQHASHFIDRVDPFEAASKVPGRGWRSGIRPMMSSFGIDSADELREAWRALRRARAMSSEAAERIDAAVPRFERLASAAFVDGAGEMATTDADDRFFGQGRISAWDWAEAEQAPSAWSDEVVEAWRDLRAARAADPELFDLHGLLYRFPPGERVRELWNDMFAGTTNDAGEVVVPEEAFQDFTPTTYRAVRNSWRDGRVGTRLQVIYTRIFQEQYREVVRRANAVVAAGDG